MYIHISNRSGINFGRHLRFKLAGSNFSDYNRSSGILILERVRHSVGPSFFVGRVRRPASIQIYMTLYMYCAQILKNVHSHC